MLDKSLITNSKQYYRCIYPWIQQSHFQEPILKIYWRNKNATCTRPVCKTGMAYAHFFLLLYAFECIHNTKFKNNLSQSLKNWIYLWSAQLLSRVQLFAVPWTVAHQAPCLWDSPGKNTGMGCHFLLHIYQVFSTNH